MYTRTFKLCLNAGTGSAPFINVSQTDRDEVWLFELYTETGERYIPSSGAIIGIKSDGHGIANTGTVDSEGRVVITETEQMTAAAGRSIFELSIDGLTHGTANFIVNVEKKPIDGAIMSDSDLSLISQAVDSAAVIVDVIGDGDPSEVIGEHVDAWLDDHPEATTTVEDGAITAPKINQSLWDKLLVSEEASGNPASFDDGADDIPVSSLKVNLEPIQLGSGDPSPSNIRPIIAANGKNILQVTATSQTINGVTFTVNSDGTIKANGTATAQTTYFIATNVQLTAGNIIGGSTGGSGSTYGIGLSQVGIVAANGDHVITSTEASAIRDIYIRVASGVTLNNVIFKPMIRLASITDSSYQPYQGIAVERTGKNLLKTSATTQTINGVTFTVNNDGTVSLSGTSTARANFSMPLSVPLVDGDYILSGCPSGGSGTTYYQQAYASGSGRGVDIGGGVDLASPASEITRIVITIRNADINTDGLVFKPMVRLASETDETYEPYTSASYPYTLGREVYGGTVDLATGVLTVTHKMVELNGNSSISYDANRFYANGFDDFARKMEYTRNEIISDKLPTVSNYGAVTNNGLGITGYANATSYQKKNWIYFGTGDPNITTPVQMKEWLAENPITVCYELKTPQTIQLTPTQEVKTLLGYNIISSSGTVNVIYHADTKLYVDKMTAVDNNIIAPTEADFVATRNYTVNDLVIVNDTLYKVTANIATGSAITVNTNVQQTTLGALIKALS